MEEQEAKQKLSNINTEFDIGLLTSIIKRNAIWIFIFLFIGFLGAFFTIRYSQPIYESSSVVKIGERNEVNRVMEFENIYETSINAELTRLNSKSLFAQSIKNLPLSISYFSSGKILDTENYRTSNYEIKYQVNNSKLLNQPIWIKFLNQRLAVISTNKESYDDDIIIPLNSWFSHRGLELKIIVSPYKIENLQESDVNHYFIIHDENKVVNDNYKKLEVNITNTNAKTLGVTFKGTSAKKCADLANSLAQEFLSYNVEKKKESANKMISFTEEQIEKINRTLSYYERMLQPYRKLEAENTTSYDYKDFKMEMVKGDQKELSELKQRVSELSRLKNLLENGGSNEEIHSALIFLSTNDQFKGFGDKLMEQFNEIRHSKFKLQPNHPQYDELNYKIEIQKSDLLQITTIMVNELDKHVGQIETRLKEYFAKEEEDGTSNFDRNNDFMHLSRMYEINNEYYSKLLSKKAEYEMVRAGFVSDNEIIEKGQSATSPISPNKQLIYIFFLSGGFLIGLIIIVVKYLLHNTVNSINDITKHTNVPVLGMVPGYNSSIPVSQLIVDKNPKSLMTEAFRSIRSNLQFISNQSGSKVLTVTSTISGEGKTFVAINLGGIIAFSDKKVILLDLDMRKPKTHIGFNVQNTIGMSTLLIGKTNLDECIQKSSLANLDFITAGPIPPNPSELIISQKLEEVIEELKTRYDVVIIDTPPVGIVTDALPILQKVDYPIYIVRADYSKKVFLENITNLKENKDVSKLSVILNGIGKGANKGGYGNQYGYGYGYGYGYTSGYYVEEEAKENKLKKWFKR